MYEARKTTIRALMPALAIIGVVVVGGPAGAQSGDHHQHGAPTTTDDAVTASLAKKAYQAANQRMHEDMNISFTGNADIDFARAMIPHHQGAIDMAQVVLEYGSDSEIRRLAHDIIVAQEAEIAFLKEWLARNAP